MSGKESVARLDGPLVMWPKGKVHYAPAFGWNMCKRGDCLSLVLVGVVCQGTFRVRKYLGHQKEYKL